MTNAISFTDDLIDVRDVIERFEELESAMPDNDNDVRNWDDLQEFTDLQNLLDDLKNNGGDEQWRGDWYPVTLIRDSYFNEYMDEMIADCYEMPKDLPSFMIITLDYDALQSDYTPTDMDGVTYWYR